MKLRPKRWISSSLTASFFAALTALVLSYSPTVAADGGGQDCWVTEPEQEEGLCCWCFQGVSIFNCSKEEYAGETDRCENTVNQWCPDDEEHICGFAS